MSELTAVFQWIGLVIGLYAVVMIAMPRTTMWIYEKFVESTENDVK